MLRRQAAEIFYPLAQPVQYTGETETSYGLRQASARLYGAGLLDCFVVVRYTSPNAVYSATSIHSGKECYSVLDRVKVTATHTSYRFYSVQDDRRYTHTFDVAVNLATSPPPAIIRVNSNQEDNAFIIVDTEKMYRVVGTYSDLDLEIEPSRICWQTEEVTSFRCVNEYRDHDIIARESSVPLHPDKTMVLLDEDNDTLRLVDGYNCHLEYDEDTATLFIEAGPGLGKGLPTEFPWDTTPYNIHDGIKTANGINQDGDVPLGFSRQVVPEYIANGIRIRVRTDN